MALRAEMLSAIIIIIHIFVKQEEHTFLNIHVHGGKCQTLRMTRDTQHVDKKNTTLLQISNNHLVDNTYYFTSYMHKSGRFIVPRLSEEN